MNLVEIKVLPPWYATSWFKLLLGGIVLLVAACVEYRIRRKQQASFKGSSNYYLQALLSKMDSKDEEDNAEEEVHDSIELTEEDKAFVDRLNKIIEENISNEEFGVNMLAESVGMSRASLYNKVKHIAGIGVNDYINKMRIERSVYLLTHTDLSISEISYEVGFNYPRYFSTSFKNMKGITPSRFKEENRKKRAGKNSMMQNGK